MRHREAARLLPKLATQLIDHPSTTWMAIVRYRQRGWAIWAFDECDPYHLLIEHRYREALDTIGRRH